MNHLGMVRLILHKYTDEKQKPRIETYDTDIFAFGFVTDYSHGTLDEMIAEEVSMSDSDLLALLPDDAKDGVYEIWGQFWFDSWKEPDTPNGYGDWNTAWELREQKTRQLNEDEAEHWHKMQEPVVEDVPAEGTS